MAEIEFDIGAKVILQSPAAFQLLSANSARLEMGKATVEIKNERARGFKILTPEATFVDQGTEFGVEVAPGGSSKVHVFKGLVDVDRKARRWPELPPLTQRLVENVGARMESGEEGMTLVEDTGECFIRSMDEADRDRHTVAYWRFEDRPLGIRLAPYRGEHRIPCGRRPTRPSTATTCSLYRDLRPRISGDVPVGTVPQTGVANRGCLDKLVHSVGSGARRTSIPSRDSAMRRRWISRRSPPPNGRSRFRSRRSRCAALGADVRRPRRLPQPCSPESPDWNRRVWPSRSPQAIALPFALPMATTAFTRRSPSNCPWRRAIGTTWRPRATGGPCGSMSTPTTARAIGSRPRPTLPKTGSTALACGSNDAEWSIGRGRDRRTGWPGEYFEGWIDEVRISDMALEPAEFLFTPRGQGEGHRLWSAVKAGPQVTECPSREPWRC